LLVPFLYALTAIWPLNTTLPAIGEELSGKVVCPLSNKICIPNANTSMLLISGHCVDRETYVKTRSIVSENMIPTHPVLPDLILPHDYEYHFSKKLHPVVCRPEYKDKIKEHYITFNLKSTVTVSLLSLITYPVVISLAYAAIVSAPLLVAIPFIIGVVCSALCVGLLLGATVNKISDMLAKRKLNQFFEAAKKRQAVDVIKTKTFVKSFIDEILSARETTYQRVKRHVQALCSSSTLISRILDIGVGNAPVIANNRSAADQSELGYANRESVVLSINNYFEPGHSPINESITLNIPQFRSLSR
jgi:hypothetical protein